MAFLEITDYKAVADDKTLSVIHQQSTTNLQRAEKYAAEEVSSYLRSKYNMTQAFALTGDNRNQQLVMIMCDIALYHLISWLPLKMGFEIREIRYKRAIEWLESVQAGKASPELPPLIDSETGEDIGNPMKWGSMNKNKYDW
ncbi:MAG TPA: DUF1320 family protein [Bacteroidales bacterium]|jgi:phage gp36-like protein|nr:DUF1320 family protein [Bacteroidales bacterium]